MWSRAQRRVNRIPEDQTPQVRELFEFVDAQDNGANLNLELSGKAQGRRILRSFDDSPFQRRGRASLHDATSTGRC
jgi:hypothetical protein